MEKLKLILFAVAVSLMAGCSGGDGNLPGIDLDGKEFTVARSEIFRKGSERAYAGDRSFDRTFAGIISSSSYDTLRNDSGIMFKMVEQDYRIELYGPDTARMTVLVWNDAYIRAGMVWRRLPEHRWRDLDQLLASTRL